MSILLRRSSQRQTAFRNYVRRGHEDSVAEQLVDKASLLTLTAPEMTVLVGGLRSLGANVGQARHGVFTERTDELTNDFFVRLLDMNTKWQKSEDSPFVLEGPRPGRPTSSS